MKDAVKEKLKKEISEIRDIMYAAQSSFKIVDYILRIRGAAEGEFIDRSQYLKYSADMHWGIYITEMSKLFSKRKTDHFNLHQFINKFKSTGEYSTALIPTSSIDIWENNLLLKKEAELIINTSIK